MGSVFPLDLILFLTLIFSKPLDASETWPRIYFSTRAHPVDPAAEHIDAVASLESESGEQQQLQPTTTTTRWSLSPFLKAKPAGVFQ